MKRKIGMFFMSLWLLFVLIFIITIDIPITAERNWEYIGTLYLLSHNMIPLLCIIAILIACYSYYDFTYSLKGTKELAFEIIEIESIDYEHLTFLTTYIVPLVCFNFFSIRYQIVLIVLLFVIGSIYIRTDLFYANPTLALLNFRIFKVSGIFVKGAERGDIVLITKDKLIKGDKVVYVKLDNRVYYAQKLKPNNL